MCSLATLDVVEVVTVFCQVFGVGGVEGQAVTTRLQLSDSVVTLPVFVARNVMGVEPEVIWALEGFLTERHAEGGC